MDSVVCIRNDTTPVETDEHRPRFEELEYTDTDIVDFEGRVGKIYDRGVHQRWLFEIKGPRVHELILEFFSTFRFGEAILSLDTVRALQFQLGGAKHRMSRREFTLAIGLHISMDIESVNITYLFAWYLRRFASGRKRGAMIYGGILLLVLMSILGYLLTPRLERQLVATAGVPEVIEGAPDVDEGAQAVPAPVQAPQPPLVAALTRTMA
ncbi:hypothetical protein Tco_1093194 [Tanacetum coccineum]|uniref:Uncharacterized protein n=1 Tax=Tanacetum coccineum TaxID=301880 RepID=A0ABQ5ID89_9ASTR